jgi:hypothetical protein
MLTEAISLGTQGFKLSQSSTLVNVWTARLLGSGTPGISAVTVTPSLNPSGVTVGALGKPVAATEVTPVVSFSTRAIDAAPAGPLASPTAAATNIMDFASIWSPTFPKREFIAQLAVVAGASLAARR